jgi:hypothetical protein
MTLNPERVISIALPDEVWRAFTQAHPEPVSWLKARIEESIESARIPQAPADKPLGRC